MTGAYQIAEKTKPATDNQSITSALSVANIVLRDKDCRRLPSGSRGWLWRAHKPDNGADDSNQQMDHAICRHPIG
jgi:hypothetical protein